MRRVQHIYRKRSRPVLRCGLQEVTADRAPRIRDQQVQSAQTLGRALNRPSERRWVGDIPREAPRLAGTAELIDRRLQTVTIAAADGNGDPFSTEVPRYRQANTGGAA